MIIPIALNHAALHKLDKIKKLRKEILSSGPLVRSVEHGKVEFKLNPSFLVMAGLVEDLKQTLPNFKFNSPGDA